LVRHRNLGQRRSLGQGRSLVRYRFRGRQLGR
jgi:hypothetical protein